MFRRITAALTYRAATASQTLGPLVIVGVLACLSMPPLALSTGEGKDNKGCPTTGTPDPAPCLAEDGTDVGPPPAGAPPPAGSGAGGAGTTTSPGDGAPTDSGPPPASGAGDAGSAPTTSTPQPEAPEPPSSDSAPAKLTTTTDAKPAPAPPPAPEATPERRPRRHRPTRLGKPKVEARSGPASQPPRLPKSITSLRSGGGVSGTAPLPVSSPLAPGPSTASSVPNVLLDHFPIPPFLLPVYQAAGTEYDVPWQVLAAINEIETDYGRNLSVSSAGAQGWMQFMPSSWRTYGVDANGDGRKDPYNPADAIFAAGRYLKAAGADHNLRQAIYSYNHAWWYVDSVMLRARLVRALPNDLVSSLTALTQGRIPVAGPSRWHHTADKHHRQLVVEASPAAPVVAVNDGQVVRRGFTHRLGAYLILRDAYGNTYTYAHLGSVAGEYAAVRPSALDAAPPQARMADTEDPRPRAPATAGSQHPAGGRTAAATPDAAPATGPVVAKERLFAHPSRPASYAAGGDRQVAALGATIPAGRVSSFFAGPVRLSARDLVLRPLRRGAQVIAGTVLGHLGPAPDGRVLSDMRVTMRPTGAPAVDAQPFVNGWRLLAASGVYGGAAGNALSASALRRASIGQILLMTKEQLIQRVLADPRIRIYPCGRRDIATGQIDRRVLATLEYLAASDLRPLVSALKCGHSYYTTSGTVSEHSYGDAVDIASINGIAILGHQGAGSITDRTIRKLLQLQGTMRPHQIISLMTYPGADNTLSLPDHANHIHVGFSPGAGVGPGGGITTLAPGQWTRLVDHLGEIENPTLAAPTPLERLLPAPPR
jgi:soluble lytic murein transglycosylase-like protein